MWERGAGVCWQTVEDMLWSFPNAYVRICWRWGNYGSRMGYHGNILLSAENQWEGGEAETKSLIMQGGIGRDRDRQLNFMACHARIVSGWVLVV